MKYIYKNIFRVYNEEIFQKQFHILSSNELFFQWKKINTQILVCSKAVNVTEIKVTILDLKNNDENSRFNIKKFLNFTKNKQKEFTMKYV